MPATTRRQSRLLAQVQTSSLLQLPYEILVMILELAGGDLKMASFSRNNPAIPQITSLKLVCKVFACLADDILVQFAKDKEHGFRLARILCEPNERSLNLLKAVSANKKLNPLIQSLHCYSPKNFSDSALTYLEDFSEVIRTFQNVEDLMVNSTCRGSVRNFFNNKNVEWEGVGEVFFEWFSQILWTLSNMRRKNERNLMLDVGSAPLSVLTSWIPYGCSIRTRTFSNITTIFIDIDAIDEHDGGSQAWNIILKNSTCLQRLYFDWDDPYRCRHRRTQAANFIYQCLKFQYWRDLYRLGLPLGCSNTELFGHFLCCQPCLYSLDLSLDFEDFESAEGAVGFLNLLKHMRLWECSIGMFGSSDCWDPTAADQTWTRICNDGVVQDERYVVKRRINVGHYVIEGKKEWEKEIGLWRHETLKGEDQKEDGGDPADTA